MMTSAQIHQLAKLTCLTADIQDAYDFGREQNTIITSEWINAIDPESMKQLKDIWQVVDGSYSLISLAWALLKGEEIKMAFSF